MKLHQADISWRLQKSNQLSIFGLVPNKYISTIAKGVLPEDLFERQPIFPIVHAFIRKRYEKESYRFCACGSNCPKKQPGMYNRKFQFSVSSAADNRHLVSDMRFMTIQ